MQQPGTAYVHRSTLHGGQCGHQIDKSYLLSSVCFNNVLISFILFFESGSSSWRTCKISTD